MQLRRNHSVKESGSSMFVIRVLVFVFIIAGALVFLADKLNFQKATKYSEEGRDSLSLNGDPRTYIPKGEGILIHKKAYSLAWDTKHKSALWVAYRLNKNQLRNKKKRDRLLFQTDKKLMGYSSDYEDYTRSGYDRGHLVAAADMSWDSLAYEETFLMSNISPQKRGFNGGIWKELEILSRNWTYAHGEIIILSGPVFDNKKQRTIGQNSVAVPSHFYKIVCSEKKGHPGCIGFLIPNEVSYLPLRKYIQTIDEIEAISGLDFFHFMWEDAQEERIESTVDTLAFSFNEGLFKQRIEKWNYQ